MGIKSGFLYDIIMEKGYDNLLGINRLFLPEDS